jgi:hypothetical protein
MNVVFCQIKKKLNILLFFVFARGLPLIDDRESVNDIVYMIRRSM